MLETVNTWQSFEHPHLGLTIGVAVALLVTAGIAVLIRRVSQRSKFRPETLMLLVIPAMIVAAGAFVDDARADNYREEVVASGAIESGWSDIESAITDKYNVDAVAPHGDATDVVIRAMDAASSNVNYDMPTWVNVQLPDSENVQAFILQVEHDGINWEPTLHRAPWDAIRGDGIDPESLVVLDVERQAHTEPLLDEPVTKIVQ